MVVLSASFSVRSLRRSSALALGSFLFPTRCIACDRRPVERFFRGGVCDACWEALPGLETRRCSRCDEAIAAEDADLCGRCLMDPPGFARLRAAAPYRGAARGVLLAFKFRGADFLAAAIARRMHERLRAPSGAPRVVAAPARRAASGGYRPALLLGAAVAARLGLPFDPRGLEKARPTERQSRMRWARRDRNVRGAFRARPVSGAVLLVDDVSTSGATARECARVLTGAGAESVEVWCFARASRIDLALEPAETLEERP
ncbi:MAG: ComF family protein [Thermoanaerobaculia bacterium]